LIAPVGRKDHAMNRYLTVGLTLVAGAALIEAALIPGLVIGGAAVLAPRVLPRLRRHLQPARNATVRRPTGSAAPRPETRDAEVSLPAPARLGIKRAVAKTITFLIIVTTLDFTTNYIVIGELATAAGLSGFALVAGPLFYLAHETAWNYLGPSEDAVEVRVRLPGRPGATATPAGQGFTISRALAKTITFRSIATVIDFTANYVVVRDVATAAGLSAVAFVFGPFVYLGHEKIWDCYDPPRARDRDPPVPTKLLAAPSATA
jgi:uncharacterized membrane protein